MLFVLERNLKESPRVDPLFYIRKPSFLSEDFIKKKETV